MASPTAHAVPAYHARLPVTVTNAAAQLSEVLPHLTIEARHVAAQLHMGIHGRRRAGPGEEFWEFRPFVAGESAGRIDWRRSARDDRLSVREREWESASAYWLWVDLSPSMLFSSSLAKQAKRDRALVLGLALADILVHTGERVGLLGATPPMATRGIINKLALAMMPRAGVLSFGHQLPEKVPLKRADHVVLVGDFIMPMAEFSAILARLSQSGAKGTVLLIRDPVEESFPFLGEIEFEGMEEQSRWKVGDVGEVAAQYRARIGAINEEMRRIALRHGFGFIKHLTDRPAADTLLMIAGMLGGQHAALPPSRQVKPDEGVA